MNKHNEFMKKLSELMEEYGASFSFDKDESSCGCCGAYYEFTVSTSDGSTDVDDGPYIYPYMIKDKISE